MILLAFCCNVQLIRIPAAFSVTNKCKSISTFDRTKNYTRIPVANHKIDMVSSSVFHFQCFYSRYSFLIPFSRAADSFHDTSKYIWLSLEPLFSTPFDSRVGKMKCQWKVFEWVFEINSYMHHKTSTSQNEKDNSWNGGRCMCACACKSKIKTSTRISSPPRLVKRKNVTNPMQ